MKRAISMLALPAVFVVAVVAMSSIYIVDVREKALVTRFGEVVKVRETPGMGLKVPFLDKVVTYDARILGLPTQPMEVTPLDDRRLVVDAFARWQIVDVVRFRRAVGSGGIAQAQSRLEGILTNAIRGVLGSVPSTTVLSNDRAPLMNQIRDQARSDAEALGVRVIDVRLTRTDLPEQNLNATYGRMRAEREREAADEVARGGEAAQRVRASADRTVVELTSEARRQSEVIRGEADAVRNGIYAAAFSRDPEFFAFTRSMESYDRALQSSNSSIVLRPDGEFFSYLNSDGRANAAQGAAADAAAAAAGQAAAAPDTTAPADNPVPAEPATDDADLAPTDDTPAVDTGSAVDAENTPDAVIAPPPSAPATQPVTEAPAPAPSATQVPPVGNDTVPPVTSEPAGN